MTSLLSGSVQPPLMTLLSSTSKPALSPLFRIHTDHELPSDSFVTTIPDNSLSLDDENDSNPHPPSSNRTYIPKHTDRGSIAHHVVHIQSPTINTTFIQAGTSMTAVRRRLEKGKGRGDALPLGVELEWLGLQIKRLGRRDISFEVGLVDARGREGVVRCSSFKKSPTVHPHRSPPLVHLPLKLPQRSASTLTNWLHVSLHISPLLPLFQSLPRPQRQFEDDDQGSDSEDDAEDPKPKGGRRRVAELPSGRLSIISYIRVYANCRVRRVWFAADGERTIEGMGGVSDEWGLYAAEGP